MVKRSHHMPMMTPKRDQQISELVQPQPRGTRRAAAEDVEHDGRPIDAGVVAENFSTNMVMLGRLGAVEDV